MTDNAHTLHVTFFNNFAATTLRTENLTLVELQERILAANAASKDKLPWLKCAIFGTARSAQHSLRHDANTLQITGIETDYDAEQMAFDDAVACIRDAELCGLLYTSPSHSPDKPRWRILCPTSKALDASERSKMVARLNGLFRGVFSPESFTLSQAYYYGSVNGNPAHQAVVMYGDYIDERDDLDATAIGKPTNGSAGAQQAQDSQPYPLPRALAALLHIPNAGVGKPHGGYKNRGALTFAFVTGCLLRGVADNIIAAACLDAQFAAMAIFEHVQENGGARYVARQLRQAKDKINENPKSGSRKTSARTHGKATLVKLGKPRAVRWLWQWHLKRGSIEILAGEPGLGKTQILCSYVATITAGKSWPNGDPAPSVRQRVIMLVAEDNLDDELTPRLLAAGANIDLVRVLKCIRKDENDEHFIISEHIVELENAIKELGNVAMVTIDPITSFLGTSAKIDSHKAQDVRSVMRVLQDVLEREDITCSMITHPAKSAGSKPLDHFIGSQAFGAGPRVAHLVTREMDTGEDGERAPTGRGIYSVAKTNHKYPSSIAYHIATTEVGTDEDTGELIEAPYVVWDEEIDITAAQAIAAAAGVEPADWKQKRRLCANWLSMELSNGPKLAEEIMKRAKALNFGRKVLDGACEELGIVKEVVGFQGKHQWSLVF